MYTLVRLGLVVETLEVRTYTLTFYMNFST
jgi:hypothetical protein